MSPLLTTRPCDKNRASRPDHPLLGEPRPAATSVIGFSTALRENRHRHSARSENDSATCSWDMTKDGCNLHGVRILRSERLAEGGSAYVFASRSVVKIVQLLASPLSWFA